MVRWLVRAGIGLAGLAAVGGCDLPPEDVTFIVDTLVDTVDANPGDGVCADIGGDCSLRAAVMEGNADGDKTEILLAAGEVYELLAIGAGEDAAATGDLDLIEPTYIRVDGPGAATINAAASDRAIDVHGDFHQLRGIVIEDGEVVGDGGGIRVNNGVIDLENSRVTSNTAFGDGGGIFVDDDGWLYADVATIDDNEAVGIPALGGGVRVNGGRADLRQVTISGNSSATVGGGIASSSFATVVLDHSTLADNISVTGGDNVFASITTFELGATIFGEAPVGSTNDNCDLFAGITLTSLGHNVDVDGTCGLTDPTDQTAIPAQLHPLADTGGTHPTHLPAATSPAIDTHTGGILSCGLAPFDADARGVSRPNTFNCDSGAVEGSGAEVIGPDCTVPPTIGPGSQLQYCNLSGQLFILTDLTGADLKGANLTNAQFVGATLTNAEIAGALVLNTDFGTGGVPTILVGATGTPAGVNFAVWDAVTCPDGTPVPGGDSTCVGHFLP